MYLDTPIVYLCTHRIAFVKQVFVEMLQCLEMILECAVFGTIATPFRDKETMSEQCGRMPEGGSSILSRPAGWPRRGKTTLA